MMMENHGKEIWRPNKTRRCIEDRLSSLPEHILVDILSLLPLKSAIVTSLLSRRWQHLWTQIKSFKFSDIDNILLSEKVGYTNLLAIYDKLLKKLTSPSIISFETHFSSLKYPSSIGSIIESWVIQVCTRNVEKIKVFILPTWVPPPCVFRTKSIVEIDLKCVNVSNLPSVIDLPNLKKLSIEYSHTCSPITKFLNFINSCSSIEDLYISIVIYNDWRKELISDVEIKGPNLRRLDMDLLNFYYIFVIDAPNLEYLTVRRPMKFRFVQVPKALLVIVFWGWKADYSLGPISQCVRSLQLDLVPCEPLERLPYLTCLNVAFHEVLNFNRLMKFLEFCPVLEVIRLKMNLRHCEATDWERNKWHLWRLAQFQTNMKNIEIELENAGSVLKHQTHVVKMVKYLVRSVSKDLKQLTLGASICDFHAASFSALGKNLMKKLVKVIKVSNYEMEFLYNAYWSFVAWF